jgi:hypothetical protein
MGRFERPTVLKAPTSGGGCVTLRHKRRTDKWIMEQINTREMPHAKMLPTKMHIVRTKLFALDITKRKSIA